VGSTALAVTPTVNEIAELLAGRDASGDFFGYSLAVESDTAVIVPYGDGAYFSE
jgi:hypothetical protein